MTNDAREDEMDNNIQEVSNMVGNLRNMVRNPEPSELLLIVHFYLLYRVQYMYPYNTNCPLSTRTLLLYELIT